jgi:P27 family predicted phage terminase small subunit
VPEGWTYPPGDLDAASKDLWTRVQHDLRRQGTWAKSDRDALERYVRALARGRDARAELEHHGSLTAVGSQGQPVPHPALKIAREAEHDAAEYARDLLLTPRARRTAGVMERSPLSDELDAVFGPLPGRFG